MPHQSPILKRAATLFQSARTLVCAPIFLVVILALIAVPLVCSRWMPLNPQATVHPPGPISSQMPATLEAAQPDLPPSSDWITLDAGNFQFRAPPGFKPATGGRLQQCYAGQCNGRPVSLAYNYGAFTDPLDPLVYQDKSGYTSRQERIDGKPATIISYQNPRPGLSPEYVVAAHVPGVNGKNISLTIVARCISQDDIPTLRAIIAATKFAPAPLSAKIIVLGDGPNACYVALELTNTTNKPVGICTRAMEWRASQSDGSWYESNFRPDFWFSDGPSAEQLRTDVYFIAPGKSYEFNINHVAQALKPGAAFKVEASYSLGSEYAKTLDIWAGWVKASNIYVQVSPNGIPILTPAGDGSGPDFGGPAQQSVERLRQQLAALEKQFPVLAGEKKIHVQDDGNAVTLSFERNIKPNSPLSEAAPALDHAKSFCRVIVTFRWIGDDLPQNPIEPAAFFFITQGKSRHTVGLLGDWVADMTVHTDNDDLARQLNNLLNAELKRFDYPYHPATMTGTIGKPDDAKVAERFGRSGALLIRSEARWNQLKKEFADLGFTPDSPLPQFDFARQNLILIYAGGRRPNDAWNAVEIDPKKSPPQLNVVLNLDNNLEKHLEPRTTKFILAVIPPTPTIKVQLFSNPLGDAGKPPAMDFSATLGGKDGDDIPESFHGPAIPTSPAPQP